MTTVKSDSPTRLDKYRQSDAEKARTHDLLSLLVAGRQSVLDIGARDGHFSRLLGARFPKVVALDLETPSFDAPGIEMVKGDVTRLQYPDNSFDCVFCAEVLEHVPQVELAAAEIARVARHDVIIGVPYKQDTRVGRTTCSACGKTNPPWGHINTFDETRLRELFPSLDIMDVRFVGSHTERTNVLSAWLLDRAHNPWGTYDQGEPCVHCGHELVRPAHRGLIGRMAGAIAARINSVQQLRVSPRPVWIHVRFAKR